MHRRAIAYWIITLLVMLPNVGAGLGYMVGAADNAFLHLGYPVYFAKILGVWKLVGAVIILAPIFTRWIEKVKEFAYAGYFVVFTSAMISHVVVGDTIAKIMPPGLMLVLLVASYLLRAQDTKIVEVSTRLGFEKR